MTLDNKYYIYFHINPLKNEIFYVGKGKDNRAFIKTRRSRYWNNITKKYGYIVDIVEEDLDEDDAFEREIFYIKKIGRRDLGLGPLVNQTDGGDGVTNSINPNRKGCKLSDEHRKKIGDANRGKKLNETQKDRISKLHKGKSVSDETKKKMSDSKFKMSNETKDRMSKAKKGKKRGPYKKTLNKN